MSATVSRATTFLDSIGVDTHIPYTDGGYSNLGNVEADLKYLGVSYVRDGVSNGENGSAPLSSYETLAGLGVKFTIVIAGGGDITTASMENTLGLISQLNLAVPGSVLAVEGVNEVNNSNAEYNGVGGIDGAVNLQRDLYAAVHSATALPGVQVDYFTGYDAGDIPIGPNPSVVAGLADFDTQHPYPQNGSAPAYWVAPTQALPNEGATPGPAVYTETGYSTNLAQSGAVNEDVQAKYSLDLLMDDFKNGISQTYLYQLMDAYQVGSPQGDDGFGLFDTSNAPKEAATAIHNLVATLTDTESAATTFGLGTLNYALTGMPSSANSELLEKSDGTFDLVLWNEPQIWNATTQSEVVGGASAVSVALGATYASVEVFDPLSGTAPIATYSNISQLSVALTDHPLIIEVAPTLGTAPVSNNATPSAITLGSGGDTILLKVSEDAYLGDAQFTISVDGAQVGGTQTASALHSSGQDQTFSVLGNFGTGPHTVTVDFLNDAYAGTAATDRNLYVDSITADGTTQQTNAALLSAGPQSFSVGSQSTPPSTGSSTSSNSTTPATSTVTLGSGPDVLALQVSEDAYAGDAEFTVAVDGSQIGGVQTATASHAAGQSQTYDVLGNFIGANTVTVTFLNDAYAGTPSTDRNLYETGATINGQTIAGAPLTEMSEGPMDFFFQGEGSSSTASSPAFLNLAEDAYQGDAQFTVSVDGGAASTPQTVTASFSAGKSEAFSLGNLTVGSHDIAVSFINDLYNGTPSTDRNLYVTGINVGGNAVPNATASILGDWTTHFTVTVPS